MLKGICLDCFGLSDIFLELDMNPLESIVSYVDELNDYLYEYEDTYDQKTICIRCNNEIDGEYLVKEEKAEKFKIKISQYIGEAVSRFISYCSHCEIVKELDELNNISVLEFGEKKYSDGENVVDYLENLYLPEEFVKYVIKHLSCICCEFGFDKDSQTYPIGMFDESIKIFSEDEIFDSLEIDMEDWYHFAEKYQIYLQSFEITNFMALIKKTPMLAFKHSVGEKLYRLLKNMYEEKDYVALDNRKLFRGRKRSVNSARYTSSEMWEPPFGVSSHGRYNIVGTSVLYLTDNKNFVPYEVNFTSDEELDLATLNIKKPLKILDLSNLIGGFGKHLSQSPNDNNVLKLEYLLTNYISECCRQIGFHGVKYKGVKMGNYNNYALINYEKNVDIEIISVDTVDVRIKYEMKSD